MAEIKITKDNFKSQVLESKLPVVLDFWATWCGPCRMVAPELEKLAEEYDGKLVVGKVNVDEEGELAAAHGIESIPTLLLYKGGKIKSAAIGYRSFADLVKWIED